MTRRLLLLIALLAALAAPGHALAADSGGDNTAVAINTKDGSSLFKFAFSIKKVLGDVVDNTNAAVAYSSCESCRTTAIAIQIVLVVGSPSVVVPENYAIAINENCTLCQSFATAFQFVIGVPDASVGLTVEGKRELRAILRAFKALKNEEYTLEEYHARTQALRDRLRTVLATQLVSRRTVPDADDADDADQDEDEEDERPAPPSAPAETTTSGETTAPATTETTPATTTETQPTDTETEPPPATTGTTTAP